MTNRHLEALGRVCVTFQKLEFFLGEAIKSLGGLDDSGLGGWDGRRGRIFVARMPFKQRCEVLEELVRGQYEDSPHFEKLRSLLKAARAAEEERNKLIHSTWILSSDDGGVVWRQKDSRHKADLEPESVDTINAVADGFGVIVRDLTTLSSNAAKDGAHIFGMRREGPIPWA